MQDAAASRIPMHRYRPLPPTPPSHAALALAGILKQPPWTNQPWVKEPTLWCTVDCQRPTGHVYTGIVEGKASTTYHVFTCRNCLGRRVCGCY